MVQLRVTLAIAGRRPVSNGGTERMWEHLARGIMFAACLLAGSGSALAQSQTIGAPPEALNMRLVGANDLQARSAYQPTIHRQGERWIAYIGHHGGTDDIPAPVN